MNAITRLYYHFTAYLPRKLPATTAKYERMKCVLIYALGVPDEAPVWALVAGQISSQHAYKLRMSWGNIANAAKRIQINNLAQEQRKAALAELQKRLEEATQKHSVLIQGIDKLLAEHPDVMTAALGGDSDALELLASEAQQLFPEQGATPEQWVNFVRNQAIQKNVEKAKKETQHDQQNSEELKAADAEPGPRTGQITAEKQAPPLPAQEVGKRGREASRGPKGTA